MEKGSQYSYSKKKKILQLWRDHCEELARLVRSAHKTSGIEYLHLMNALDEHERADVWAILEADNERKCTTSHKPRDNESKL